VTGFDPAAHPALVDLGPRLRELAGDAAYRAGHDYLRQGQVQQGVVAASTAYATVRGSTDYRVSVAFAAEPHVTCTCPAHRRSRYCKHVVAVCVALLQQPADFAVSDARPEPQVSTPGRRRRTPASGGAKSEPAALRTAGLETVDRLLVELAEGGLVGLGPEKAALIAQAGELVRALKLRRLGSLVLSLQRAVDGQRDLLRPTGRRVGSLYGTAPSTSVQVQTAQRELALEPSEFLRLLSDLYLARRAVGAQLNGQIALDPRLAEDLLGKTWRAEELEPATDFELVEVGYSHVDDGEFSVETSFLADPATGAIYAERQILPLGRRAPPKPRYRERLEVAEAGLYPGEPPRRIRLQRMRRAPLRLADVERLIARATTSVASLGEQLAGRISAPFGPAEVAVLFRPAALIRHEQRVGALDVASGYLALDWPAGWTKELPGLLPPAGRYALFGLLALGAAGACLRPLSVVSPALQWDRGPIYPDAR
jgi:hypothetical protein